MYESSGLMANVSTYQCPLCYAKQGFLDKVGDKRLRLEIITLCERWLTEGGNEENKKISFAVTNLVSGLQLRLE